MYKIELTEEELSFILRNLFCSFKKGEYSKLCALQEKLQKLKEEQDVA